MRGDTGFTLLEVMAAFVIMALAAVVLYQAGVGGVAQGLTAARMQEAVVRAQSRLASVGTLTQLQPLQAGGDDGDGFSWQLAIVPEQSEDGLTLYDVRATERFGTRPVVLTTKRLGSSP
ncbi:MAG TPA: prepilin-type N-terminal cleavage/methylation domain-containing protein [Acidocella sp.]|jgi:general secretion pathway protein I|nr:prepilin-type N-terminal cleavage/methylation domain-containing protein [Acidocella sp.]